MEGTQDQKLNEIHRLCIVNFLELQEMKRRLNIATKGSHYYDTYADSNSTCLDELTEKLRYLVRDYPPLGDEK
jgi:hypothetical protein